MARSEYAWTRFWCPRGAVVQTDDDGYLLDPDSWLGKHANADLLSTSSLTECPCVILLGEAGIGKSREAPKLAKASLDSPALYRDLGTYSNEEALQHEVFESTEVQSWKAGTGVLTVVLDSLDEAMLGIGPVKAVLERKR